MNATASSTSLLKNRRPRICCVGIINEHQTASGRGSDLQRGKLPTSTIEQRRSNTYFRSRARWRFTKSSRRAPSDIDSQSRRPSERERTSQTSYEPVSRNIPNSHSVEKCYDFASCKTWQLASRPRKRRRCRSDILRRASSYLFSFWCAQLLWSVGSDSGRNCQTLARRRGGAKSK